MLGGAYRAFFARFFFCCPVPSSFNPSCCAESFGFGWCLFPCNRVGSVSDGGDDMVGVRTLLLFPPFFVFPSSPVPSPCVASVHPGPVASSDTCWPGRQRSRAHVCGWAMCRVHGHCDWWTWWWFQNMCEGAS